jgi:hypothetical protein
MNRSLEVDLALESQGSVTSAYLGMRKSQSSYVKL